MITMEKKLEVKNLVISFKTVDGKVQAVRDISFDLYKGETIAIVGESGSGKSVTSKAILGISSGNALIEGGEILYDGQDLLRISEDDFHKIRGDKIAMIFQDPLSSLNPIVRIGTQLTEAMILKNKAFRKNSRRDFNSKLALLLENFNEVDQKSGLNEQEYKEKNLELTKTFDRFNTIYIQLENEYLEVVNAGEDVVNSLSDIILFFDKNQNADYRKLIKRVAYDLSKTIHPFYVKSEDIMPVIEFLKGVNAKHVGFEKKEIAFSEEVVATRNAIRENVQKALDIVHEAMKKKVPNYFTIGYYVMKNPDADIYSMDVEELNKMTREYIDNDFMISFINKTEKAIENSEANSNEKKKLVIERFKEELKYFSNHNIEQKECKEKIKELISLVESSINYLSVVKDSLAYTFKYTFKVSVNKYFESIKANIAEQKRFARETRRYEAKVARGKELSYKVSPLSLVDLDTQLQQIRVVLQRIVDKYEEHLNNHSYDYNKNAVDLIDFFKEKAVGVANRVTKKSARAKAIKLMEEVGIPEPTLRFRQYPFEFSGGMRQRIVIAIALAADPDILICDEPTTALDVTIQAQILELINKIKKERNLSIIFITHDLGVVANMADKIAVMYAGKIVEFGTDQDIFYDPRHPYTWALLASMPDLETKEKLEAIPGTPPNMIYPPIGDAFAQRNKYALEIDFEKQPPMFKISDTHYAATWLLHPNAPKVDLPKIVKARINRIKNIHEGGNNGSK